MLVVRHDSIEHCSIRERIPVKSPADSGPRNTLADALLARLRKHIDPMTAPYN